MKSFWVLFVYFAYYFVNDKEVSKDIVSNAFEHILEKGDDLEISTAKAYLSKIIKSKCIDYLRRQNIRVLDMYRYRLRMQWGHLGLIQEQEKLLIPL